MKFISELRHLGGFSEYSSTNHTDGHDIAKILLKVALDNPNLCMSLSGPIVSIVITKFSCRVAMFTGSLMLASGMVSTAFVPDINWAFLTFGVLAGIVT